MPEATAKPLLLLVDGHSLAFRSFYAFSKGGEGGLATKDGRPTSVTYGFLKALLDNGKTLKPQGVAIASLLCGSAAHAQHSKGNKVSTMTPLWAAVSPRRCCEAVLLPYRVATCRARALYVYIYIYM